MSARRPGVRLTARGGVLVMFITCFLGLRLADLASWGELGGAVFLLASSLTVYYMRAGGQLPLVVSTPLLFFVACVLDKVLATPGLHAALAGSLDTLGHLAPWLLAGTGLTLLIALFRGLPEEVRALAATLRS